MPSAALVHAAFFTVGIAVGVSTTAFVGVPTWKKRPVVVQAPGTQPVIQVGVNGSLQVSKDVLNKGAEILRHGNPGPISDLLVRKAYVAAYDRRLRHPAWTAEHLTLRSLGRSVVEQPGPANLKEDSGNRALSVFMEDESIPFTFRAKLQDYFRSGYDRGHMVPAADATASQEAMNETFLLSNIAPQVGDGFNRHYWAYLEHFCRRLTSSFSDVFVFTIPLYLPKLETDGKWRVTHEVIGSPPNVSVPTHFAKVILTSRPSSPSNPHIPEISTGAFVLPNSVIPDTAPLESFVVPVEEVERAAGLLLFSDAAKASSKHLCQSTKCEVIVRRFDDARKRPQPQRAMTAP